MHYWPCHPLRPRLQTRWRHARESRGVARPTRPWQVCRVCNTSCRITSRSSRMLFIVNSRSLCWKRWTTTSSSRPTDWSCTKRLSQSRVPRYARLKPRIQRMPGGEKGVRRPVHLHRAQQCHMRPKLTREPDLQSFKQALADLQRQVDELDAIKAGYHEEVLEGEDEVSRIATPL